MTPPLFNLTATGGGYYRVLVGGVEVSRHTAEREAVERAVNEKRAQPAAEVSYDHSAYAVRVDHAERRGESDRRQRDTLLSFPGRRQGQRRGPVRQYPVDPQDASVSYVTITSQAPPNLGTGDTHQIAVLVESAVIPDGSGQLLRVPLTGRTVTYGTSNAAVATVTAGGLVAYVGDGTATITATCESVADTVLYTCAAASTAVADVFVTPTPVTIIPGATQVMTATVRASDDSILLGRTVTWASSDTNIATVGADSGTDPHTATVTGVADGTVTITATCETVDGTASVEVLTSATFVGLAELPRSTPTFTYSAPTGGTLHQPGTAAALQTILAGPNTTLQLGDIIELTAGVQYTSASIPIQTFPNVTTQRGGTSAAKIYVRTANIANLPAAGTRVSAATTVAGAASIKAEMPLFRQRANGASPPIRFANAAHGYVLSGIAVDAGSVTGTSRLVELGIENAVQANFATDIVFDRCYIAAETAANGCGRPFYFMAAGADIVIRDCWIYNEELTGNGSDTQAILVSRNCSGPALIENNFLAGSSENIMFGGTGPGPDASLIPADFTIRRNYVFKQTAWRGKNLFELKCGLRVLFEDNVCEPHVPGAQFHAINLKSVNQTGNDSLVQAADIVLRYNRWKDIRGWFKATPGQNESGGSYVACARVTAQHNLVEGWQENGADSAFYVQGINGVAVWNNTVMSDGTPTGTAFTLGAASDAMTGFSVRDNIFHRASYGVKGQSLTEGTVSLEAVTSGGYAFAGNTIITTGGTYPAGQTRPASVAACGFTDSASRDYSLTGGSALLGTGYAGGNPGCDVATVLSRTAGSVTGDWS